MTSGDLAKYSMIVSDSPITNYDIRNQAFHFNNTAVNFYVDFSFLCRPIWWNATVSPFPLVLIIFGVTGFPRVRP